MTKRRSNNKPKWDSGRSLVSNKDTDTGAEDGDTITSTDTDTDTDSGPGVGTKRPLKR